MALQAYLTLKIGGTPVPGSSRFKGREGQMLVNAVRHEIGTDRDQNGQPKGEPKHRSFTIVKDIDVGSALLHRALRDNVTFSLFLIEFTRFPPAGGQQEIHYSIGLQKAKITAIRSVMANVRVADNQPLPEYEEVSFAYEDIAWNWSGKGDGSGDSNFTEADVDMSDDETSWVEALEAKMKDAMKDGGVAAGNAAVEALKSAFTQALQEPK